MIRKIKVLNMYSEYNIDYLYSLDSDVTEELIGLMERFGYA